MPLNETQLLFLSGDVYAGVMVLFWQDYFRIEGCHLSTCYHRKNSDFS